MTDANYFKNERLEIEQREANEKAARQEVLRIGVLLSVEKVVELIDWIRSGPCQWTEIEAKTRELI